MTDRALTTTAVNPAVAAAMEVYDRLNAVRNVLAPDLNDQELSLFALVANRSGLDPFARQVYAVKRAGKVTFQTGIDGYRSIAERSGQYGGSDEPEYGPMVGGHPEWARVTVYRIRDGVRIPQPATAYWDEFHPGGTAPMWQKMPRNQLAKCAEALALRKAFPYLMADLYTDTEMEQAGRGENAAVSAAATAPTARERLAARRAALEASAPVVDPVNEEEAEAEDAAYREDDEYVGPVVSVCQWKLGQGPGKPALVCGIELDADARHPGEHSWSAIAMSTGGRVIRPEGA